MGQSLTARNWILAAAVVAMAVAVFLHGPIPQDPAYHAMADTRSLLDIPNAMNVLSNLAFLVVGVYGLTLTRRPPYVVFFIAAILTAIGSAYYHLAPDDSRLVWDRLPMTIAFMALLTAIASERIGISSWWLVPLIALGVFSVAYWSWTGDLRAYVAVQFGSLILIVLLLSLYPAPHSSYLWAGVAAYAAAKVFELADRQVFAIGHIVSGHTLKHLAAAGGMFCVALMLRARPRPERSDAWVGVVLVAGLGLVAVYLRRHAPSTYAVLSLAGYAVLIGIVLIRLSLLLKYAVYDRSRIVIAGLTGFAASGLALVAAMQWSYIIAAVLAIVGAAALFIAFRESSKSVRKAQQNRAR